MLKKAFYKLTIISFCLIMVGCGKKEIKEETTIKENIIEEETTKEETLTKEKDDKKIDEKSETLVETKVDEETKEIITTEVSTEEIESTPSEIELSLTPIEEETKIEEEFRPKDYQINNEMKGMGMNFGEFGSEYCEGDSDFYTIDTKDEKTAKKYINDQIELLISSGEIDNNNLKDIPTKECGKGAYRFVLEDGKDIFVLSNYSTKNSDGLDFCSSRRFAMDAFVMELIKDKGYDWEMNDSCITTMNNLVFPYTYNASGYSPSEDKTIRIYCEMMENNVFFYYMTKE